MFVVLPDHDLTTLIPSISVSGDLYYITRYGLYLLYIFALTLQEATPP